MIEQETDAVIRQRFGVHGLRLFRLLYLHRQLEQKQIAEQAMLPPKVILLIHSRPCFLAVRICCLHHKLLLAGFVPLSAACFWTFAAKNSAKSCYKQLYVDTAFMHDVLDHLCWQSRDGY